MLDRLTGLRDDHFCHQMTMAVTMVAFEAQQTAPLLHGMGLCFGQDKLCFRRRHMGIENRHHQLRVTGPHGVAARFRRAETLQMEITYPHLVQTGG